ncbi:site-specific integrase, partial [Mycobacterium kiyosense]
MDRTRSIDAGDRPAWIDDLLIEYEQWLDRQRGLAPVTVSNYSKAVAQFLGMLAQPAEVSVCLLDAGMVTEFMVEFCSDRNTNSAKSMARSVRSFLRFAHATGRISADLSGAVPVSAA